MNVAELRALVAYRRDLVQDQKIILTAEFLAEADDFGASARPNAT